MTQTKQNKKAKKCAQKIREKTKRPCLYMHFQIFFYLFVCVIYKDFFLFIFEIKEIDIYTHDLIKEREREREGNHEKKSPNNIINNTTATTNINKKK